MRLTTPDAGACMATDMYPSGCPRACPADNLLPFPHDGPGRPAEVLCERDPKQGGERKLPNGQLTESPLWTPADALRARKSLI